MNNSVSYNREIIFEDKPAMSQQTRFLLVMTVILTVCFVGAMGFIPSVQEAAAIKTAASGSAAPTTTLSDMIGWPGIETLFGLLKP